MFCSIAQHRHERGAFQGLYRRREKVPGLMIQDRFSDEGWEKGNFGNRWVKTGWSPYGACLSDITLEGNFR